MSATTPGSILDLIENDGINNGLKPVDHSGATDTGQLIMDLSREAIAQDVYNLKRNAANAADMYRRQGNAALFQGVVNVTAGLINMGNNASGLAQENNVQGLSGKELMGWYFQNDMF